MPDKPEDPQALAALAVLNTYPGAGTQTVALASDLFEDLVTLRRAAIAADWNGVFGAAAGCIGRAAAIFRRLQDEIGAEAARLHLTGQVAHEAAAAVERVIAGEHGAEWVKAVREHLSDNPELLADDPELLAELEPDLQSIEQGSTANIGFLREMREALPTEIEDGSALRGLAERPVVAGLTVGLLGLVHTELNRALEKISVPSGGWPGIEAAFRYEASRFGEEMRNRQIALYQSLGTGSMDECLERVAALTAFLEQDLPRFARAQARARLATQTLLAQGSHAAAQALGRLATLAGSLTREAIASQAAGYRLAFDLIDWATVGGELRSLAAAAPFDRSLPEAASTALADIGPAQDGTLIEIEGVVTELRARRSSDGKLIGQLTLSDPADGATISVALLFVQPVNVGITTDAYVRANGIFRMISKLHDGGPAVEVQRLSLARLARQAWRLAFLRSAAPYYECWRNQSNIYWSLGPHQASAEDATDKQGAGELIYTPFVRGG